MSKKSEMSAAAAIMGRKKSAKKTAAVRKNGALGGRPCAIQWSERDGKRLFWHSPDGKTTEILDSELGGERVTIISGTRNQQIVERAIDFSIYRGDRKKIIHSTKTIIRRELAKLIKAQQ